MSASETQSTTARRCGRGIAGVGWERLQPLDRGTASRNHVGDEGVEHRLERDPKPMIASSDH